jgi:hypothetical protein
VELPERKREVQGNQPPPCSSHEVMVQVSAGLHGRCQCMQVGGCEGGSSRSLSRSRAAALTGCRTPALSRPLAHLLSLSLSLSLSLDADTAHLRLRRGF